MINSSIQPLFVDANKPRETPNIIPIEILNVTDSTNIEKAESKKDQNESKQIVAKQKKFIL